MDFILNSNITIFLAALILLISILVGKVSFKFGLPTLLLFLAIGMAFGTDGLGIEFDDPDTAQFIGVIALSIILFSGGMDTKIGEVKPIALGGITLATLGTLLTTFTTGGFIYFITQFFGENISLGLPESLLLAAVMSSTDSASVFSILRTKKINLKERLGPTLELESGSNDPMAYMLTIVLITYIQQNGIDTLDTILTFITQLAVGALYGYLFGKLSLMGIKRIYRRDGALYPLLFLAITLLTFSITSLFNGNGYLAVYITGVIIGNSKIVHKRSTEIFFNEFAWLWQIVMFISLGLLVNPHEIIPVSGIGLSVGIFMIFVARPISVFISLLPFKKYSFKGKLYISWVGLRGAVPIIFATYPLIAGIPDASLIFNIVFFITILSLLLQGTTVAKVAKWLNLIDETPQEEHFKEFQFPDEIKSNIIELLIEEDAYINGKPLMELDTPENSLVVMVKRKKSFFVPNGKTIINAGDVLLIITNDIETLNSVQNIISMNNE